MATTKSSFGADPHGHGETPGNKQFWLSAVGVIGCFLLFIAVMAVAYIPPNEVDSTGQSEVVKARFARLEEMRAKEATASGSYAWANQPQQVVRIPIERAVTLLPARLAERGLQPEGVSVSQPVDSQPAAAGPSAPAASATAADAQPAAAAPATSAAAETGTAAPAASAAE